MSETKLVSEKNLHESILLIFLQTYSRGPKLFDHLPIIVSVVNLSIVHSRV